MDQVQTTESEESEEFSFCGLFALSLKEVFGDSGWCICRNMWEYNLFYESEAQKHMRIGLLATAIGNFGQTGFYNVQETGLAKMLDTFFDEVIVYRLVSKEQKKRVQIPEGCRNTTILFLPSGSLGMNGKPDLSVLDRTLDVLIHFSDTQLSVPEVYRWTVKNNVKFIPYIGVIRSHSTSRFKRMVINFLFGRNLSVYRKCRCLTKTLQVEKELRALGVEHVMTAPVGLDLDLLKQDYAHCSRNVLKTEYGYREEEKIVLFVGRLTPEKQPEMMIDIFRRIAAVHAEYRLLMVGEGEQRQRILRKAEKYGLQNRIKLISSIPNNEIWKLYCLAEVFVNLNRQEIFGMAILEAMYYECRVVAWRAPGPEQIIENGRSGWLAENEEEVFRSILEMRDTGKHAHDRILEHFTWKTAACMIKELAGNL